MSVAKVLGAILMSVVLSTSAPIAFAQDRLDRIEQMINRVEQHNIEQDGRIKELEDRAATRDSLRIAERLTMLETLIEKRGATEGKVDALFSAVIPGGLLVLSWLAFLSYTFGKQSERLQTLWEFHVRRGKGELAEKGLGTVTSPIHLTAPMFEAILPFLREFLPFYAGMVVKKYSESRMAEEFERKFGDLIMERVCIPNKLTQGACLVAIIAACQEEAKKTHA